MQLFEKKSFSRLSGLILILTYCICAIISVAKGNPMPDLLPVLSMTILGLYGINTLKAINSKNAPKS